MNIKTNLLLAITIVASFAAAQEFARRLNEIFSDTTEDIDFKNRFKIAVERDSKLSGEVAEFRAELNKLL